MGATGAYAAGLVTGLVAVLGADPVAVVKASKLTKPVAAAVLRREGDLGVMLDAVEEFGRGGTTTSEVFDTQTVAHAHLHALGAAVATVDSLGGG